MKDGSLTSRRSGRRRLIEYKSLMLLGEAA
jgi:hypothetical protein